MWLTACALVTLGMAEQPKSFLPHRWVPEEIPRQDVLVPGYLGSDTPTLSELWTESEVIALCRVGSHRFVNFGTPDAYQGFTEHDVTATRVLKGDDLVDHNGVQLRALQSGGVERRDGHLVKIEYVRFLRLVEGQDYVLSLRWWRNMSAYIVVFGRAGAMPLKDGRLASMSPRFSPTLRPGATIEAFAGALSAVATGARSKRWE